MSLYAKVNCRRLERLSVAEPDSTVHPEDEPPYEDIEDPRYLDEALQLAYPPDPKFIFSYGCYLQHAACVWTVNENDPADDYDKFSKAPIAFQRIMLSVAGCIMIGDGVVLDRLALRVTPINVRVMFANQMDRENTHQIIYSKWCDISPEGQYYRSQEFKREYMGEFTKLAERYPSDDIRVTLFFIMVCENIMFAPMFQTICYCATLGYAQKISNSNLLVMRDEYLHYVHARGLLASLRRKIKLSMARRILFEMRDITMRVFEKIIGDYDDGTFNIGHVRDHFYHIIHGFMTENSLYLNDEERQEAALLYSDTPARAYMTLPKSEIKINLMESTSTIYEVDGISKDVNMSF